MSCNVSRKWKQTERVVPVTAIERMELVSTVHYGRREMNRIRHRQYFSIKLTGANSIVITQIVGEQRYLTIHALMLNALHQIRK